MKNQSTIKLLVIILAVVSIVLFVVFTVTTLKSEDESAIQTADVANYGMATEESEEESEMIESANGNFYSVDDEGTMEMDSIPNDAGTPDLSGETDVAAE